MKVIDTPRTNKIGNMVAYISPYGQCYRAYVVPRNPRTEAQMHKRDIFGSSSSGWGLRLTEPQRQRWVQAALTAPSHPSLGQYSHLSGQQLCVKINSTLRCVGQPPLDEPPAPVVFGPNPIGDLVIVNDEEGGVRLDRKSCFYSRPTAPCGAWASRRWMNPRLQSCSAPTLSATWLLSTTRKAASACCSAWIRQPRTSCSLARLRAARK